jgi:hypothetical protein
MDEDLFFDDFDEKGDEDDPFGDYGGEDDPFAALDEAFADDPFRELEATPEREGYVEAPEPPSAPARPVEPLVEDDDTPAWLRELGVGEDDEFGYIEPEPSAPPPEPAAPRAASGGPLAAVTGTGPEGTSFGLTARQRMLLALFLFLDVSVVACGLLYALGAINLNF